MQGNVDLLDCTLRDGGLGLEDSAKAGTGNVTFQELQQKIILEHLSHSQIEIIEVGTVEETKHDMRNYAIYQSIQSISEILPETESKRPMYVAMFRGPDIEMKKIPIKRQGLLDGIRVILRYSELERSLEYCKMLSAKGYEVFLQPMLTMRYSDDELKKLISTANDIHAYALYFVDSYGYMNEDDVYRLFQFYEEGLNQETKIGFHAHNNMSLAYANAICFLKKHGTRNVIVDSCVTGMGQGAGNLQTELITHYLNCEYGKQYEYNDILEICEILEELIPMRADAWGYSTMRMLPAIHRAAYKYAVAMRNDYHMSYPEMNRLFSEMPHEMKQRFLKENLKELIDMKGISR